MTDNQRLSSIEKKLDQQSETLIQIQKTLQEVAIQDEKISTLNKDVDALWRKWDDFTDPKEGVITTMQKHQASCPRSQIKALWTVIIPMAIALLGMGIKLITS